MDKQQSNPFSTGGGGVVFETRVQAAFVVLMLSNGPTPCLKTSWPIKKIKLQGKHAGYNTDDCIVFTHEPNGSRQAKVLIQIKHSVEVTESDEVFGEVIAAGWRDFQNEKLFLKERDALALITGPLSAIDIHHTRILPEWARHFENAHEFITNVEKTRFSSNQKSSKLRAIRHHLNKAKGSDVNDDELWNFIKHFNLIGYDLDIDAGVTKSLLQTVIEVHSSGNAKTLWHDILNEVQNANQYAGTITVDKLPQEIQEAFKKPEIREIPKIFTKEEIEVKVIDTMATYAPELAMAALLGAWDESFQGDKRAIEKLSLSSYTDWVTKIREILSSPNSPLSFKNGKWKVLDRFGLLNTLGSRIFNDQLDRFKEIVLDVLQERDPQFELPKEERIFARVREKVMQHSPTLRNSLAEGLAILGSNPKVLTNCSLHKPESIIALSVRDLLEAKDWVLWASVNDFLPLLAEADPNEFLNAMEKLLNEEDEHTLKGLFEQEGISIGGWNYLTGILWALETLAWHEDYLGRASVLLGRIAEIDPGGNWANRPINSLTTIFLPWLPQTCATIEIRQVAIKTVLQECPSIGWKLLLSLLPKAHQVTSGSRKPKWRNLISQEMLDKLSNKNGAIPRNEYFDQVNYYALLAFDESKTDFRKLKEFIDQLDDLPSTVYSQILDYLSSDRITSLAELERVDLWEVLMNMVMRHRKFHDANWALPQNEVEKIAHVTDLIKPSTPSLLYRRLFGNHESDLYEDTGNFEEQRKKIEGERSKAVGEILGVSAVDGVIEFAKTVVMPWEVGLALGRLDSDLTDPYFLPHKLISDDKTVNDVSRGYIWSRFYSKGWSWIDGIETGTWTADQKAAFLVRLPFEKGTWTRAKTLLDSDEQLYWNSADARPYGLKEDLYEAITKLLENRRPRAAIQCLNWLLYEKMDVPLEQTIEALLTNPSSKEPINQLDDHATTELIKWLQDNPNADQDKLYQVEWTYIEWLDHHFGLAPKTLEQRLADDPAAYCDIIKIVFLSDDEKRKKEEITEERKKLAARVYELLEGWEIVPGTRRDGSFDGTKLKKWVEDVKHSCEESGHLAIAMDQIGKVLAHFQPTSTGLWIHRDIAEVLDARDAEEMRNGFAVQRFNMRGVHGFSGGAEEKAIANDYRKKAEALKKAGFFRFAATVLGMATTYDHDSEREASRDPFEE